MEGRAEGGSDTGQVDCQGEERSISRMAGVVMVTELGNDVIVPWLIQTWQGPITPPLETSGLDGARRGKDARRKKRAGERVKVFKNKT